MKKITILTLALWSITTIFAVELQFKTQLEPQIRMNERSRISECTQNWLQNNSSDESSSSGGLRGLPEIGDEKPPADPVIPIGGGWSIMLALGSVYLLKNKFIHLKNK